MGLLSNSHLGVNVTIRLEQRKSYTFTVHVIGPDGSPIDCTGSTFSFVAERSTYPNEVVLDLAPTRMMGPKGFLTFDIQASELELDPGEYPYAITMRTPDNYSLVIAKGNLELIHNPETGSTQHSFPIKETIEGVEAVIRGRDLVKVTIGTLLPPGMNFFTDEERDTLERLNEEMRLMKIQLGID